MDTLELLRSLLYVSLALVAWYLSYTACKTGVFRGIGNTYRASQPFGFWLGVVVNIAAGGFLIAIVVRDLAGYF